MLKSVVAIHPKLNELKSTEMRLKMSPVSRIFLLFFLMQDFLENLVLGMIVYVRCFMLVNHMTEMKTSKTEEDIFIRPLATIRCT